MARKRKKEKQQKSLQGPISKETAVTRACTYLIWAGLFLSLLVPMMVNLNTFYPFISYRSFWFMATVQFTFAVWLFLAYHNPSYRPNLNLVTAAMALFILAMTLSTIFGADPAVSFWSKHERMTGLLMHLHLAAYFLVLTTFLNSQIRWKVIFSAAIGICSIVSIWGIADNYNISFIIAFFDLLRIIPEWMTTLSNGGSTLGNASFKASYYLINAFIAIYLIMKSTGRLRITYGLALFIIILGIYLNPRGSAVQASFLIGLVILGLLYLAFNASHSLTRLAGRIALGLGFFSTLTAGILTFIEGSFVRNFIMRLSGLPGRIANWESALQALKEKPLFGWGPENSEIALYQYYDPRVMLPAEYGYRAEPWHDRAHNIVIDTLITTGIFGLVIFIVLITSALVVLWYYYFKEEKPDFWVPGIFTALFAAHFIQNLTVFDMLSSYILIFVVLAFAARKAWPISIKNLPERNSQAGLKKTGNPVPFGIYSYILIVILAVFVFLSFNNFVYKPHQGGYYANQAIQTDYEGSLIPFYAPAIETSPLGRQHIRGELAETASYRLNRATGMPVVQVHFPEVEYMVNEMEKAIKASPENFRFFYGLGQLLNTYTLQLLAFSGDQGMRQKALEVSLRAEEVFREALDLSPANVNGYTGLAQALAYQGVLKDDPGFYQESLDLLLIARDLEPRLFNPHLMSIRIASDLLQDQELVTGLVEEALEINAGWKDDLESFIE